MRTSTPDRTTPSHHDAIVVEAPTAEAALAEVSARLGSDAAIVAADKVLRGGVGGFFARELVRLEAHATTPMAGAVDADAEPPMAAGAHDLPAAAGGIDDALTRLTGEQDRRERSFEEVLRERLAVGARRGGEPTPPPVAHRLDPAPLPAVHGPDPAPLPPVHRLDPASATPATEPAGRGPLGAVPPGAPDWSPDALRRLGLPAALVMATEGLDPADDAAWINAISGAVSTLCRPLPPGDALFAGPRARGLATALGIATVTPPEVTPLGSVATVATGSQRSQARIAWARERRWLHLVAGGTDWRRLLFQDPLAVSWVGDEALPGALRVASELGLVLGYGLGSRRGPARRATPVDVAVAVRAQVPRR